MRVSVLMMIRLGLGELQTREAIEKLRRNPQQPGTATSARTRILWLELLCESVNSMIRIHLNSNSNGETRCSRAPTDDL